MKPTKNFCLGYTGHKNDESHFSVWKGVLVSVLLVLREGEIVCCFSSQFWGLPPVASCPEKLELTQCFFSARSTVKCNEWRTPFSASETPPATRQCFLCGAWRIVFISEEDIKHKFLQPWWEALKLIYLYTREGQWTAVLSSSSSHCKAGRPAATLKSSSRSTLSGGSWGLNCRRRIPPAMPNKASSCWWGRPLTLTFS